MPQRIADAAHIVPYLTHRISRHEQPTPEKGKENNGRIRQTKPKKGKPAKQEKSPTRGRETNRNHSSSIVPRSRTSPSCNRIGEIRHHEHSHPRAQSRFQGIRYADEIPDYPPPTFQEAMSSPPVSVCPSTATLGLYNVPSPVRVTQTYGSSGNPEVVRSYVNSDSDSDESLEVIDIHRDTSQRGGAYHEDEDVVGDHGRHFLDDHDPPTPITSTQSKRRHMSLSPLRLFAHKPIALQERALSAQPASPYSFHRNVSLFRSTTSLKTVSTGSFFRLPLSATSSTSLVKADRRAISKGKERSAEPLETWEVLDPPTSLMSAVESLTNPPSPDSGTPSPVQTHIFTFDCHASSSNTCAESNGQGMYCKGPSLDSADRLPSIPTNYRDDSETIPRRPYSQNVLSRQYPSSFVPSNLHDCSNALASPLPGPGILQNPGTSPPSPTPASKKMTSSLPQTSQSCGARRLNFNSDLANPLQLALETPLPPTPIDIVMGEESTNTRFQMVGPHIHTHFQFAPTANEVLLSSYTEPVAGETTNVPPRSRVHVAPNDRTSGSNKVMSDMPQAAGYNSVSKTQRPIPSPLQVPFPSVISPDPTSMSDIYTQTPTRRHYPGRPLPKTPQPVVSEVTRNMVDSLYAPNPENASKTDTCLGPTFPHGLLIDFDESTPVHSTLSSEMNSPTSTVRLSTYNRSRSTDGDNGRLADKLARINSKSSETLKALNPKITGADSAELKVSPLVQGKRKNMGEFSYDQQLDRYIDNAATANLSMLNLADFFSYEQ
ncbi:hypothetical protein C8J55DRAFT_497155 [Lentinula edodes]|uniref:Uncharacterized protein n=1 Tax=Lentinula lateritia TaxID=40482 RepID=A0A9W9AZW7_9AGAR|nr:hypothetical protein C8J55DRAFT_497155 [Lentinula edodes]